MWLFQWDLIAKYYHLFHLNNQRTEWTWKSGKMSQSLPKNSQEGALLFFFTKMLILALSVVAFPTATDPPIHSWHTVHLFGTVGCWSLSQHTLGEMQCPEATSLSRAVHNRSHIHRAAQDYLPTELQAHPPSCLQYTISVYRWQVSLFSNSSNHSAIDFFELKWTCSVLYVSQSMIFLAIYLGPLILTKIHTVKDVQLYCHVN